MQHVPLVEFYSLPGNGDPLNKLIRLDIIGVADKALGFLESRGRMGRERNRVFLQPRGVLKNQPTLVGPGRLGR